MLLSKTKLHVLVFNVGQGDQLLIRLPGGEFCIIDTFYRKSFLKDGPPAILLLEYLMTKKQTLFDFDKDKEKIKIWFLNLTHFDKDHVKGLKEFVSFFKKNKSKIHLNYLIQPAVFDISSFVSKVKRKLEEPSQHSSNIYNIKGHLDNLEKINKLNISYDGNKLNKRTAYQGMKINRKTDNNYLFCYSPLMKYITKYTTDILIEEFYYDHKKGEKRSIDHNSISSVLGIEYDGIRLLFNGDSTEKALTEAINVSKTDNIKQPSNNDFVKLAHHGSKHSSTKNIQETFMKENEQTLIANSCGNQYGHPDQETLDNIIEAANNIKCQFEFYCTSSTLKTQLGLPKVNESLLKEIFVKSKTQKKRNKENKKSFEKAENEDGIKIKNSNFRNENQLIALHFEFDPKENNSPLVSQWVC